MDASSRDARHPRGPNAETGAGFVHDHGPQANGATHGTPLTDDESHQHNGDGLPLPLSIFSGNDAAANDAILKQALTVLDGFALDRPSARLAFVAERIVCFADEATSISATARTEPWVDCTSLLQFCHMKALSCLDDIVESGGLTPDTDDDEDLGAPFLDYLLASATSGSVDTAAPPRYDLDAPAERPSPSGPPPTDRSASLGGRQPSSNDGALRFPHPSGFRSHGDAAPTSAPSPAPSLASRAELDPSAVLPGELAWPRAGETDARLAAEQRDTLSPSFAASAAGARATPSTIPLLVHSPPPVEESSHEAWLLLADARMRSTGRAPAADAVRCPPPSPAVKTEPVDAPGVKRESGGLPPPRSPDSLSYHRFLPRSRPPTDEGPGEPPLPSLFYGSSPAAVHLPGGTPGFGDPCTITLRIPPHFAVGAPVLLRPVPANLDNRFRHLGLLARPAAAFVDFGPVTCPGLNREVNFVWFTIYNPTGRSVELPASTPCCVVELSEPAPPPAGPLSAPRAPLPHAPATAGPSVADERPPQHTGESLRRPAHGPWRCPVSLPVSRAPSTPAEVSRPTRATADPPPRSAVEGPRQPMPPPSQGAGAARYTEPFDADNGDIVSYMTSLPDSLRPLWHSTTPTEGFENASIIPATTFEAMSIQAVYDPDELASRPHLKPGVVKAQIIECLQKPTLFLLFRAQLIDDLLSRWLFSFGRSLTFKVPPLQCSERSDAAVFSALGLALSTIPGLQADWRAVQSLPFFGDKLRALLDGLDSTLAPPLGQNLGATQWRRLDLHAGETTLLFMSRVKTAASLYLDMTPAVFKNRLLEIASDLDAEQQTSETASFLSWCRALPSNVTPGQASTLIRSEHVSRVALRPAPPANDGELHGRAFPSGGLSNLLRGNDIVPLYEAHGIPIPGVQIGLAADKENPCPMCVKFGRPTAQWVSLPNGDKPKPPAGGCFIHGPWRCPEYPSDIRRLHADKPELNLDLPTLLNKVDATVVYKAYCVQHGLTPQVAPAAAKPEA